MTTRWQLEWLSPPPRRGERFLLDPARSSYSVGRSRRCDVRLASATASREHAELRLRDDGEWVLQARPGKAVLADGAPLAGELLVCEGLCIELGGDRIRCRALDGGASAPHREAPASRPVPPRSALLAVLALLVLALFVAVLLRLSG